MADAREVGMAFSSPMERQIVREEGPKTVTRRLIKHPHASALEGFGGIGSPWKPGDILYVKEALRRDGDGLARYAADPHELVFVCAICERASCAPACDGCGLRDAHGVRWPWKPRALGAMYMPRWAARTFLDVLSVRAERLGDMTDAEAVAEGFGEGAPACPRCGPTVTYRDDHGRLCCAREYQFVCGEPSAVWPAAEELVREKINGKHARAHALVALRCAISPLAAFRVAWEALGHPWDPQAWVWRIEFRRRQG